MALVDSFRGILPAMQVPFKPDYSIDEAELRRFSDWLAGHKGIGGLVTNGHTGEVFALSPKERAEVTRIVADQVGDKQPVVSGINCESITEAVEHAHMAKEAGAKGLLIMPPHIWLRFGMRPEHVVRYFSAIGEAVNINLVVHIYPAWTKAAYSSALLGELARIPQVTTFQKSAPARCPSMCATSGPSAQATPALPLSPATTNTSWPPWCRALMGLWWVLPRSSRNASAHFGRRSRRAI